METDTEDWMAETPCLLFTAGVYCAGSDPHSGLERPALLWTGELPAGRPGDPAGLYWAPLLWFTGYSAGLPHHTQAQPLLHQAQRGHLLCNSLDYPVILQQTIKIIWSTRLGRDYILIANFIGMALIPVILLSVFNYRLFRKIQLSGQRNKKTTTRQARDHKIAAMLIFVVLVFTLCNSVRIITNLYEVGKLLILKVNLTIISSCLPQPYRTISFNLFNSHISYSLHKRSLRAVVPAAATGGSSIELKPV